MNVLVRSFRNLANTSLVEALIIFLVFFSPLIHGGIGPFPLTVIELSVLLLTTIFVLKIFSEKEIIFLRISGWPLLIFGFFILLQIIKLPLNFVAFVSPATGNLYRNFTVFTPEWVSLSIYPEATIQIFLLFLVCVMVFLVVVNYINTEERLRRLITCIILSGVFYSMVAIFNKAYVQEWRISTFTNRNHFAAYIQLVIFLALGFTPAFSSKTKRFVLLSLIAVMITALFYSESRAGIISFLIAAALFIFFIQCKHSMRKTRSWFIPLVVFLIFITLSVGLAPFTQRFAKTSDPLKDYSGRFIIVADSLRIFKDFPFAGTGLGTFDEIAQKYKSLEWDNRYSFSHNEPVQVLSETGIVGFSLLCMFFFLIINRALFYLSKRNNPFVIHIAAGALIALFSVSFHSLFDFVFHTPSILLLFFIILALAYRVVFLNLQRNDITVPVVNINPKSNFWISIRALYFVIVTLLSFIIISRFSAESNYKTINEKMKVAQGIDKIVKYKQILGKLDEVIAKNKLNSKFVYMKANIYAELSSNDGLSKELTLFKEFGSKDELLDKAILNYSKAISLNPTNADYHLKIGWAYIMKKEYDLGKNELNKAILLDPKNKALLKYTKEYIKKIDDGLLSI